VCDVLEATFFCIEPLEAAAEGSAHLVLNFLCGGADGEYALLDHGASGVKLGHPVDLGRVEHARLRLDGWDRATQADGCDLANTERVICCAPPAIRAVHVGVLVIPAGCSDVAATILYWLNLDGAFAAIAGAGVTLAVS